MTLEELSKELNISISQIRTNFPKTYKRFLKKGIKIEREGKYPNTIYNIIKINLEETQKIEDNISYKKNYSLEKIEGEIFKECPLDSNLLVSNMGRYEWKDKSNKFWYGHLTPTGYRKIRIRGIEQMVHRVVMITFNPIENYQNYTVDHINGIRSDNRLENLKWVSLKENISLMMIKRADLNRELTRIIQNHGYEETLKILQKIE